MSVFACTYKRPSSSHNVNRIKRKHTVCVTLQLVLTQTTDSNVITIASAE